ncbi:hypothetical protein AB1Y20_003646 [Prymnesium parvum]|uniref:Protein kinase domain-containing protein n=1 Tax=Prymnesium parvum TaxID=97485 RepID=A0AB34J565_PRYPA
MKRASEAQLPPRPPPPLPSSPREPSAPSAAPATPGVIGQHYDVLSKVGEGTYGSVYKAIDRRDLSEVAIKRMKNTREGEGISHTAYREIALVRELRHPNVVSLKEIFLVGRELNLVFEFVAGDLAERIKQLRETHATFAPQTIRHVMRQLLDGLGYLHRSWIMHRDIKPSNILMSVDSHVKIADFGLARIFRSPLRALHHDGPVVTVWYRAPELLLGSKQYTSAVDVWACGCIMAEMMLTRALFTGSEAKGNELQQDQLVKVFRVLGKPRPDEWPKLTELPHWPQVSQWSSQGYADLLAQRLNGAQPSPEALSLLRKLLKYDPDTRLTTDQALQDSYFVGSDAHADAGGVVAPSAGASGR